MGLSCDCDERPSVFREKEVKARKEHICTECRKIIQIGERYTYIFGVWEGDAQSYHMCEKCYDLALSLYAVGFCIEFGGLHEAHQEYIAEYVRPRM